VPPSGSWPGCAGSGGPTLYDGTQVINAPSIGVTLPSSSTIATVNQPHNNTGAATVCVVLVKT